MVTLWPRQSTTARKRPGERRRGHRLRQVGQYPQHVGQVAADRGGAQHHARRARPKICNAGNTKGSRSNASASLPIGSDASRNSDVDVLGDAAGADQNQPLDQLRELVGELHGHAAAERMADDGDAFDVQNAKQVAHAVGVGRDRIVRPRLVRLAVAQQIGGDDGKPLREFGLHGRPGRRVVTDPVDQQDHRAGAGDPERAPVAVDGAELQRAA